MKITIASYITLARITLTPFIVYGIQYQRWSLVVLLFVLAMVTDFLDGFVARRYKQESKLGALLDPVADKLLIISSLYALLSTVHDAIIILGILFLIIKEFALLIGAALLYCLYGIFIKPTRLSRAASVAEMILVVILVSMHCGGIVVDNNSMLQGIVLIFVSLSAALLIRYGRYIIQLKKRSK